MSPELITITALTFVVSALILALRALLKAVTVTRRINAPEDGEPLNKVRPQSSTYLWVKVRLDGRLVQLAMTDNEWRRGRLRAASNKNDRSYEVDLGDAS
jgi:hypothetical protein